MGFERSRLQRFFDAPDLRLGIALAAGILVLVAGAKLAVEISAWSLLRKDAEATARTWANGLANMLQEELPLLIDRTAPSPAVQSILSQARQMGQVFRYKLYDTSGNLVFISEDLESPTDIHETLAQHRGSSDAAAQVTAGNVIVEASHGTPPERPEYYAEAYVPIRTPGGVIGVAEVYVDQTERLAHYLASSQITAAEMIVLVLLAGLPPALLAWRRTKEQQAAEKRVLFLAHHDALTGLPNRSRLYDAVNTALARARRDGTQVGVLALDLDNFKEVNDTLGHAGGDALLRAVADRLRANTREEDTVARLGGDEFVVVQFGVQQPSGSVLLAERLVRVLAEPYDLDGHRALAGGSIGVAVAPNDGESPDVLLSHADAALYRAKAEGRGAARFFEPGMDAALRARREMERDLRHAVADSEFELRYQPLYTLPDGILTGFEALLRWERPGHGSVPPSDFIPLAEETGLIVPIGAWVLRTACRTAASWPPNVKIAVNLSPAQFRRGDLVATVAEAIAAAGIAPSRRELEVTEGLLLQDTDTALAVLGEIRNLGVGIAMDDFGTGYSSLAYLWRFPFSKLKIDRSFVAEVNSNTKAAAIVETVVALGRHLGLTVTAEGVETITEANVLSDLGCEVGQGFLLGRPMHADDAHELLQRRKPLVLPGEEDQTSDQTV